MILNFMGETEDLRAGIAEVSQSLGFKVHEKGATVCIKKGIRSLKIAHKNGEYSIEYSIKAEFFRGLAILIDKIKAGEQDFEVIETKKFETCGIMIDVSRNAVLRVETVKDILRRIALMGMNLAMLYTEDTYEIEEYPYFGYMRGAYTKDEIKEIDAYALIFGIELVPCIQTLSHLATTLRWKYADGMRDTHMILLIDEPKTYEFIEHMIKTVSECFSSDKIHIGMDEAEGVGLGEYLRKHGYQDRYEILIRHLNRVNTIVKKYGLKPMMWSDMFFKLASKTGKYRDTECVIPKDILEKIPDNMGMVYWDYYSEDTDVYNLMFERHRQLGNNILFAGGVWTWRGMGVNYKKTFNTTEPALKSCRKQGVKHVLATMWGDGGALVSVYSALLGMQLFAEYNYYDEVDMRHLGNRFKICTGYDMEAFLLLQVDDFDTNVFDAEDIVTVSSQALFQDILHGLFDRNFEQVDVASFYRERLDKLTKIDSQGDLEYLFEYHRQLIKVITMKCNIGIEITRAYKHEDKDRIRHYIEELKGLKNEVYILKEHAMDMWYKNNKAFGFDSFDLRLGGVISRIDTAIKRLSMYASGDIDHLEELDAKRLFYKGDNISTGKALVYEKVYNNIAKASI